MCLGGEMCGWWLWYWIFYISRVEWIEIWLFSLLLQLLTPRSPFLVTNYYTRRYFLLGDAVERISRVKIAQLRQRLCASHRCILQAGLRIFVAQEAATPPPR